MANIGTWEYDIASDTLLYSNQLASLMGLKQTVRPVPMTSLDGQLPFDGVDEFRRRLLAIARNGESELRYSARPWMASKSRRTLYIPLRDPRRKRRTVVGITQDVTAMTAAEEEMRRLSHRLITVQNDEQRRLSRILHETASQTLGAIKLILGKAARLVKSAPAESSDAIGAARDLVEDALREVRSVSALLHPPMLEEAGLAAALASYIRNLADRSGLHISVDIPSDLFRMSNDREITLFRIVQESLTNVHRHAKAKNAVVRIHQTPTSVSLEVSDDGVGIRQTASDGTPTGTHGVGVSGMRERIQQHNGIFQIRRARGRGTTVFAELPIQHRQVEPKSQETMTCQQPKPKSRTFRRPSATASKSPTTIASFDAASGRSSNSNRTSKSARKQVQGPKRSST
jgi:signal transduction histidine kinase